MLGTADAGSVHLFSPELSSGNGLLIGIVNSIDSTKFLARLGTID